jgi:D-inositol-3-phosphate glycosyltransferase
MKRKIAFISEHASPLAALGGVDSGGQNVYVGELARHLVMLGYTVDVFTRWDNEKFPEIVSWLPDVRVIHIEAGPKEYIEKEFLLPYIDAFTQRMLKFIRGEHHPYQLIHANFFMSALVAADIRKVTGIPFVVTFHALGYIRKIFQGNNDRFPAERLSIERRIVAEADHIIAECPQDKEDLIKYYDASPKKLSIIPCGFNPQEFYPIDRFVARMVLNLPQEEKIILQLGRMVPRKGVENVIRSLPLIDPDETPVRLLVVGGETDGIEPTRNPELLRLEKIAKEQGVHDRVIFTGRKSRDILKYYYAAADVFVTTPWYEPFGITPLEAMACGTPVIGSDVGGIKYTVEDGKTGFLVPPENPEALASKITDLFLQPPLQAKLKENAIRRVNTLFTWTKVAQMMHSLYDRITDPGSNSEEQDKQLINEAFDEAIHTMHKSKKNLTSSIREAALLLTHCFQNNKKVLICGNGGSAAETQHLTAELVGRFELSHRKALPAISLTADSSVVTAWANDFGYDDIFARQIDAYGQKGDVLFCFSTSGQSPNVIKAMQAAVSREMACIALTGKGGGEMTAYADVNLVVPSTNTQRIQELHLHILHTICSLVEIKLFRKHSRSELNHMNGHSYHANGNGKSSKIYHLENEQSGLH